MVTALSTGIEFPMMTEVESDALPPSRSVASTVHSTSAPPVNCSVLRSRVASVVLDDVEGNEVPVVASAKANVRTGVPPSTSLLVATQVSVSVAEGATGVISSVSIVGGVLSTTTLPIIVALPLKPSVAVATQSSVSPGSTETVCKSRVELVPTTCPPISHA